MKKAMEMATLVAIIITLAVGAGMGSVIYKATQEMGKKGDIERCHASATIISQGRLKAEQAGIIPATAYRDAVKLDCPVVKKEISQVKEVADELRNCWYKTGQKANRLGYKYGTIFKLELDTEEDFCTVCAEITPKRQISTRDVGRFMIKKTITAGQGKGKRYIEYLETKWTEGLTGKCIEQDAACYFLNPSVKRRAHYSYCTPAAAEPRENEPQCMNSFDTFELGKTYYVISLSSGIKPQNPVTGLGPGEDTYTHVFIVPLDKVQNIKCDRFYYQAE